MIMRMSKDGPIKVISLLRRKKACAARKKQLLATFAARR